MAIQSVEERLQEWRQAENDAIEAERAAAGVGQAAADSRVQDLLLDAQAKRERADRLFGAIARALKAAE